MKTLLILLLSTLCAFADGVISPQFDERGFVAGSRGKFTGNGDGITNYFGELRRHSGGAQYITDNPSTPSTITNWTSSYSSGFGVNLASGYLTNLYAGTYAITCTLTLSAQNGINNYNTVLRTNTANVPWATGAITLADTSYIGNPTFTTVMYLPANTRISVVAFCDVAVDATTQMSFATLTVTKQ